MLINFKRWRSGGSYGGNGIQTVVCIVFLTVVYSSSFFVAEGQLGVSVGLYSTTARFGV